jgi:uncharacterized protein YjiS (DUF1127 family)
MGHYPARRIANVAFGVASLHQTAQPLQAQAPSPGATRHSAALGLVRKLLGWIYRPSDRRLLDSLSDHMLRDMGIEPDRREHDRFWRWR